jgi:hypothetical protein
MERLNVTVCRKLIAQSGNEPPGDDEIVRLRDMLYCLADVIADAFVDLENIDQSTLSPPGDAIDLFERSAQELLNRVSSEQTP